MKANQLASLTLRLMGIYCLVQSVPVLGMLVSVVVYSQHSEGRSLAGALVMSLLPGVSLLAVGVLLIAFATTWGERLTQSSTGDAGVLTVSFEQVRVLAFALAGVLIFASALPKLFNCVYYLGIWITAKDEDRLGGGAFDLHEGLVAAGTLLQAALGLALFFGARGFANFWYSLRTFATPKPPQG